ncbi:methyl-accepting chemotaxis protein [Desulfitibacter alkalitolerans]|uniref:methyl-accepting chemotaxis protein n=1 Tax=Desulfitibacter alkalitolerans TaxID=264641 RepID=UPI00048126A9|nr:methyl-accepting chemotaxis protein [Desulfitibacter alkalitolerans]
MLSGIVNLFSFKSMAVRLAVWFSIILLLVCASLGFIAYKMSSDILIHNTEEVLPKYAGDAAEIIAERLNSHLSFLEAIANRRIVTDDTPLEEKLDILHREANRAGYEVFGIIDKDGSNQRTDGGITDVSTRDYFIKAMQGIPNVSDVLISRATGEPIIVFAVPIVRNNQVEGVLIGIRDGNELSNITNRINFGHNGYAFMVNGDGSIIAHPNSELVLSQYNVIEDAKENPAVKELADIVETKLTTGEKGVAQYFLDGDNQYMGYAQVPGTTWSVAVEAPSSEIFANIVELNRIILIATLVIVAIGIVIALIISRQIAAPIILGVKHSETVAKGDLIAELPRTLIERKDEIGRLAKALNTMTANLRELVKGVSNTVEHTLTSSQELAAISEESTSAADQVASAAQDVSSSAEQQLKIVQDTSATIEEMSAGIQSIAGNSNEVAELSSKTVDATLRGKKAIEDTINQLQVIGSGSENSVKSMLELESSSAKIGEIVNVINGIADQTNLLALNAAIEAARAGEAGRGFSVVAEEVRKLAEQSTEATKQIVAIIKENQNNIKVASEEARQGSIGVQNGIKVAENTGLIFEEIVGLTDKMSEQIQNISASIEQMASGSQEVVTAIGQIEASSNNVTDQIQSISSASEEQSASMEEIASSSQNLARLAQDVKEFVKKFKV